MKTDDILDQVLTDLEKDKIGSFVGDPVMFEAVRKVLLAGIYYNGTLKPGEAADPSKNFALQFAFQIDIQGVAITDQMLGEQVKSEVRGIRLLEAGFDKLKKLVPVPTGSNKPKKNKGY